MPSVQLIALFFGITLWLTSQGGEATEISIHPKNLRLNAKLELNTDKDPFEQIVLITHGGLAHYDMEIIAYLQHLLRQHGYSSLAINLSLGINDRHGMYDCKTPHRHLYTDAISEIDAWIAWLKAQGSQRVILLGHSRGAAQTALYAAEQDHSLVKALILMAPATLDNGSAGYQDRYREPLSPKLLDAQILLDKNKPTTILQHSNMLFCRDSSVSAESFISYYGADPRLDTMNLIVNLKKPTLLIIAGNDQVVIGLEKKMKQLKPNKQTVYVVIEDADHFFRDLYADDAMDSIQLFLQATVE